MSKKIFQLLLLSVLIIGLSSIALAQRQTGSVVGKVTDEDGTLLPGASVTLGGPTLMGTLTYTTTEGGDFRFPAVPPGRDYEILVEMPGFRTVRREGVIVNVGKTVTISIELEAATIEEEVTVTAENPVVDITSSKISVNYSSDLIENVPLRRDFYDIIKTAPGIVSENIDFHRSFSAHGSGVKNNQVTLDGVSMNDPIVGTNMVGLPFDVFDEFEFELGAHPAEVGMTEGAYINIVTKSGGNEFHGHLQAYYFSEDMTESLFSEEDIEAVGLSGPAGYKNWGDYSFSLGGPIAKDKLWFFINARYIDFLFEAQTFTDGKVEMPRDEIQTFAKFTFKPHPNLQLTGMWTFTNWDESILSRYYGYFFDKSTQAYVDNAQDNTILAMVNWILNQNTFFDFRFNYFRDLDPWFTHPDVDPTEPHTIDLVTGVEGGPPIWDQDYHNVYYKFLLTGTRFQDNFLGGNHEIKAGIEYQRSPFDYGWFKPTAVTQFLANGDPWALGPGTGMFLAFPYGAKLGDTTASFAVRRFSAYLQDSFTVADRLTLNLGLRYDESHADALGGTFNPVGASDPLLSLLAPQIFRQYTQPDYKDVIVWKYLSPRLGAVFDIFGDGKTPLKVSWSRYNDPLLMVYYGFSLTLPDPLLSVWIDLNANKQLDLTDFYVPLRVPRDPSTLKAEDAVDPDLESPYMDEFIVGIERELFKDFSIGISYIYKKKQRILEDTEKFRGYQTDNGSWVPYTVREPGWDGEFGTSDDADITVYAVKAGAPPSQFWTTNPEGAERKYQAVEFIINKRMANRWQLLFSLTYSKFEGNIGANYLATQSNSIAFDDPNYLINRYGRLDMDRPLLMKLQGSVILPFDVMLSAYYFYTSGAPWARTLRIFFPPDPQFDPTNPPYIDVNAEAPGERRHRSINNLDLRIEKNFNIGKIGRLGIFLDVLNAVGESWYDVENDPGGWVLPNGSFVQWPTYGRFTAAEGLRTYKVSARFTF